MSEEYFERKNYNELVDFKEVIGLYIDPQTADSQETTKGIIHHCKSGEAYIIPAIPIEDKSDNQVPNDQKIETRCRLLLSVQRALIGAITSNFRAIFVDWIHEYEKTSIKLYYVLDQATEVDIEEAEGVAAEVMADFVNSSISIELIVVDRSKPISSLGKACVFQHKE